MKKLFFSSLLSVSTLVCADPNLDQLTAEASLKAKVLGSQLKQKLGEAMKAGGPTAGIEVCHSVAADIANTLSADGWTVGRTSLKNRSPNNAPDTWERDVMMRFEQMHRSNPEAKLLETTVYDNDDGQKVFRFMAAIPTAEVCTKCHGDNVESEVVDLLHKYYPDDLATGFKIGDLRGAFTLSKTIE